MNVQQMIAVNVKQAREKRNLTLDKAAEVTDVSRSMLAQIENGKANPTISVLWKIANGYKLSFTSLIEFVNVEETFIECQEPMFEEDDGKYLNYPTFSFDEKKKFEMYRIEIKVGGELGGEPHLTGSEEYVTCFQGSVEITVGENVHILNQGDSLRFQADQIHHYKNISDEKVFLSMLIYYDN